jgi:type I restriction enzyme M protein
MSSAASNLVNKVWNYCNLLRDDGVSYGDYVDQPTCPLFLKMDHERAPFRPKNAACSKHRELS